MNKEELWDKIYKRARELNPSKQWNGAHHAEYLVKALIEHIAE